MNFTRILAASLLSLAFSAAALAQPISAASSATGPKWFHHHKKNPNQKKVHHAKPTHRAPSHKSRNH